jgi:hypothetical protein
MRDAMRGHAKTFGLGLAFRRVRGAKNRRRLAGATALLQSGVALQDSSWLGFERKHSSVEYITNENHYHL